MTGEKCLIGYRIVLLRDVCPEPCIQFVDRQEFEEFKIRLPGSLFRIREPVYECGDFFLPFQGQSNTFKFAVTFGGPLIPQILQ